MPIVSSGKLIDLLEAAAVSTTGQYVASEYGL